MRYAEDSVESFSNGGELCCDVGHHADEDDGNRDQTYKVGAILEMGFQVIGYGESVFLTGVPAQSLSDEKPVDYVPYKTAGKKPECREPVLVREPHGS